MRHHFVIVFFSGVALVAGANGCVSRARMCTATSECEGGKSVCVAGRCQIDLPTVKPAVDSARRIVAVPEDIAYVKRGDGPKGGALPPTFALGKDGGRLFLRFDLALPASANVIEAYVVLRRSGLVDDDPDAIHLHATRIVEAWSGGSISWAFQPRLSEVHAPGTTVSASGAPIVRLDVRDLVRHWPKRDREDQGIAIVSENESRTGMTFALQALGASGSREPADESSRAIVSNAAPDVAPYLELYVR